MSVSRLDSSGEGCPVCGTVSSGGTLFCSTDCRLEMLAVSVMTLATELIDLKERLFGSDVAGGGA